MIFSPLIHHVRSYFPCSELSCFPSRRRSWRPLCAHLNLSSPVCIKFRTWARYDAGVEAIIYNTYYKCCINHLFILYMQHQSLDYKSFSYASKDMLPQLHKLCVYKEFIRNVPSIPYMILINLYPVEKTNIDFPSIKIQSNDN